MITIAVARKIEIMRTIYKYALRITEPTVICTHAGSIIRHVGLDPDGKRCVWIEVVTENPQEDRTFHIISTGHPVPDFSYEANPRDHFAGTFIEGPFVWHVYTD